MNSLKRYKVIISVLSVLLAVVTTLLAIQIAKKISSHQNKATVGDNVIGSSEQNWVFGSEGMLPGDSVSKTYSIVITQKEDMEMDFSVEVTGDESSLAEVLHIKVDNTNTGKTVCEGILSEAIGKVFTEYIPENRIEEKAFTYKITVTLDSSAGNEYANANLSMGFNWSVVSSDMKEGDGK